MANGKPHDNPITDVTIWNMEVFGPETDALIREIATYTTDYGVYDPFEEITGLIFKAENDRTKVPKLHQALVDLRARLRAEADSASTDVAGLTNHRTRGTMPAVWWPYRPREGFPSVPRWLMIVLLIVGAVVYVFLVNHWAPDPTSGQGGG